MDMDPSPHVAEDLVSLLTGELTPDRRQGVERHLTTCGTCRDEYRVLAYLWDSLGELPEEVPGKELGRQFDELLRRELADVKRARLKAGTRGFGWFSHHWKFALEFAAVLIVGVLIGNGLPKGSRNNELTLLNDQLRETNRLLVLSLLHQESVADRLRGINWSRRAENIVDDEIVASIIQTFRSDPNVSVRLAALGALAPQAATPTVRSALLEELNHEASPLVQTALIDLLIEIHDPRVDESLRHMTESDTLNPSVKSYLAKAITRISL
jgi:hypothetical protein